MKFTRRKFLEGMALTGAGMYLGGCQKSSEPSVSAAVSGVGPRKLRSTSLKSGVFVAEGKDPKKMIDALLKEMGGMGSLVKSGDTVVVKPNIGWDRAPEQAATTNPEVVQKIIELCFEAGAKTVKVFDRTCNDAKRSYKNSGIAKLAEEAGAKVDYLKESDSFYEMVTAEDAKTLKSWSVYKDILDADVVINVPILKHHAISGLTIGMKNLMGIIGGDRGQLHQQIDENLPDLCRIIPVELVIVDAFRILTANGPNGGNLDDVKMGNKIIASTNTTMADAYGAYVFGVDPGSVGFLKVANKQGMGEINIDKMDVKKISV